MLLGVENLLKVLPASPYLQNKYIISLLIIAFAVVAAKVILFIFNKYLEKISKKTKTKVDDLIFERTKIPIFYLILIFGIQLAVENLNVNGMFSLVIKSFMALGFVFILARAADVIIRVWGESIAQKTKTHFDDVLLPLFHKSSKVIFVIVAILWVLKIWQLNITPYLAGAGLAGLVLGLALQDSLKNVLGGVTLILDKTYKMGDKVKLESGDVGTIYDIGLRSTKLVTYDNEVIYIPNGYLANSRVQNYTRPSPKVRVKVGFGVEYGSEVEKVRKVVMNILQKNKEILNAPSPSVDFLEMGDFALRFEARFWVERWDMAYLKKLEITEEIYNALNKSKINIPFPTKTIYIKKG